MLRSAGIKALRHNPLGILKKSKKEDTVVTALCSNTTLKTKIYKNGNCQGAGKDRSFVFFVFKFFFSQNADRGKDGFQGGKRAGFGKYDKVKRGRNNSSLSGRSGFAGMVGQCLELKDVL